MSLEIPSFDNFTVYILFVRYWSKKVMVNKQHLHCRNMNKKILTALRSLYHSMKGWIAGRQKQTRKADGWAGFILCMPKFWLNNTAILSKRGCKFLYLYYLNLALTRSHTFKLQSIYIVIMFLLWYFRFQKKLLPSPGLVYNLLEQNTHTGQFYFRVY